MLTQADETEKRRRRYQFVVSVSLAALEEDLNRAVGDDPSIALVQVFYAAGTGFIAVLERGGQSPGAQRESADELVPQKAAPSAPRKKS